LLDWKEKVSAAGAALNDIALPTSREIVGPGVSPTPVGTTSGAVFVALLPPQDGRNAQPVIRNIREIAEKNFPMKPFAKECLACSGEHSV
jgi:hypothetical protein